MSHSVEDLYKKIQLLHEKGIHLHRERYKKSGEFDEGQCKYLLDDLRAVAKEIIHGPIDFNIDFSKKS